MVHTTKIIALDCQKVKLCQTVKTSSVQLSQNLEKLILVTFLDEIEPSKRLGFGMLILYWVGFGWDGFGRVELGLVEDWVGQHLIGFA